MFELQIQVICNPLIFIRRSPIWILSLILYRLATALDNFFCTFIFRPHAVVRGRKDISAGSCIITSYINALFKLSLDSFAPFNLFYA